MRHDRPTTNGDGRNTPRPPEILAGEATDRLLARFCRHVPLTPCVAESDAQRGALARQVALDVGPRYGPALASLVTFREWGDAQARANQKAVLARCQQLAEQVDAVTADAAGLIFFGPCGTGKDHLAAALLYVAAGRFGIPSRWVNAQDLFRTSRDGIKDERREADLIRKWTAPTILCLSDPVPARGDLSGWNVGLLYGLLDWRSRYLKATWATMNVASVEDAEARLTMPVWGRLRSGAELIECQWADWRDRPRQRRA